MRRIVAWSFWLMIGSNHSLSATSLTASNLQANMHVSDNDNDIEESADDTEQPAPRYSALCERALLYIIERKGSIREDLLIGHVFGNSGSLDMWRPLLRSVLNSDDRVKFRADGSWALRGEGTLDQLPSLLLAEFVAIDVETTGLKPRQQRIIEVALIRFKGGEEIERFESFLNPDRAIPAYIANLTSITNNHVEDAPRFHEIADRVIEFIGDALLVGHNVAFDINFINAELSRADRSELINERIDTMAMSMKLLSGLRKPNLDRVAAQVGLSPRKIHRAGGDAALTAEVAIRLVQEAVRQGMTSIDQLKSVSHLVERRPREDVGRGRSVMDKAWLKEIPRKPGVYMMRDQFGNVIYVGKAKSLRERASSYYSQPLGYTRKMDGLLESMVKIDTTVVGNELDALLLEAQLIRRYQPRYNTAMRSFEHYPYIKVDTANPWPRISLAKVRKDDGATYFGPYRSSSSARRTVEVINGALPLRTCTRSFKNARSYGSPCILLGMGKCLGPCTGQADRDEYKRIVHDVVQLLDGRDDALFERLWGELELAATNLDFERAGKLRRDLRSVLGLVQNQQKLREAERIHTLLLVLPSPDIDFREILMIFHGRVWARFQMKREASREGKPAPGLVIDDSVISLTLAPSSPTPSAPVEDFVVAGDIRNVDELSARLERSAQRYDECGSVPLDHHMVDENNILNRWLMRYAGHPALLPLPDQPEAHHWQQLTAIAQSLTDEELLFKDKPDAEVEIDGDEPEFGALAEPALDASVDIQA
ncbi:MAG: exonuclease domain-containing protein [Thermomicrobiales bacterium]